MGEGDRKGYSGISEVRMLAIRYFFSFFVPVVLRLCIAVEEAPLKERVLMIEDPAKTELRRGDELCLQKFGKDVACGKAKHRFSKNVVVKLKLKDEEVTEGDIFGITVKTETTEARVIDSFSFVLHEQEGSDLELVAKELVITKGESQRIFDTVSQDYKEREALAEFNPNKKVRSRWPTAQQKAEEEATEETLISEAKVKAVPKLPSKLGL